MKILIVPSWYSSHRAPTRGSFVTEQAVALARRGHDVVVAVFDRDSRQIPLSMTRTVEFDLPHIRISVPSPLHRLLGFYAPRVLASRLLEIIDNEQPDIVHAHAVRPAGVIVRLALAERGIPWCITEHSGPLNEFWKTCHGHRQIDSAYGAASRLFVVSESLLSSVHEFFPRGGKIAVKLFNGIDTDLFSPAEKIDSESAVRFLFVGEFSEKKGLSNLFKALQFIPANIDWSLSLVGEGPRAAEYRAQAKSLHIDTKLKWVGPVPRNAMPRIYAKHDMLVVSSPAETFSLVAAEALACGVPVVATRCGGPEEILGPLGLPLAAPNDPMALGLAIQSMLARRSSFDRIGAAASIQKRFSMSSLIYVLETEYKIMLQDSR